MNFALLALWMMMQGVMPLCLHKPDCSIDEYARESQKIRSEVESSGLTNDLLDWIEKFCYVNSHNRVVCNDAIIGEAIDVPAIQQEREVDAGADWCNSCQNEWCTAMSCMPKKVKQKFETCADKSRILLHSEDGKYWCHKPQTE